MTVLPLQSTDHSPRRIYLWVGLAAIGWIAAYNLIQPLADWIAYTALNLPVDSRLGSSVAFFLYDVPKVLLLLTGMVFVISIIRTFFSAERTRALLGGKREGVGNILAATARNRDPVLFMLGSTAFHRICGIGHPAGRDIFVPDRRAAHQRSGDCDATGIIRLANRRVVYYVGFFRRHNRRVHHWTAEYGTLCGGFRLENPGSGWAND